MILVFSFYLIILVVVFSKVAKGYMKKVDSMTSDILSKSGSTTSPEATMTQSTPQGFTSQKPASQRATSLDSFSSDSSSSSISSLQLSKMLGEDRKNDWMAKQLRDEQRSKQRNLLDFGGRHDSSCDAKELKKSHKHESLRMKDR